MEGTALRQRPDGRALDALRPVEMTIGFQRYAEGSVLYRAGHTVVLCTASVDLKVPAWMEGKGKGWITAEYQMHPRASRDRRESRDGRGKAPSGRTQEIQRLVGRALRAAVDLQKLGERQITIDCDVLEADGGTRTASVTGGFVALAVALAKLKVEGKLTDAVIREPVAATSVGVVDEQLALDLVYLEDSRAEVDLNMVATRSGQVIEVQGTAEGAPIPHKDIQRMMDVAIVGIERLTHVQEKALAAVGVDLGSLLIRSASS
ncbi:MAG TPA: ribonuclease PH [Labilithrix sp.]|jgi:ribonuclease PH|nr:ribonuclease PH [Labilithrix sp.]